MDRAEATGLGVAVAGHAALVVALALGLAVTQRPRQEDAMEVSFMEEVGPVSTAPEPSEAPAPSLGEELAPVEEPGGATASIPEPVTAPVPELVRPPVETGERRRPDLTRNPVQLRPAVPRVAPRQPQPQQRTQPQRTQPQRSVQQQPSRAARPGAGQAPVARGSRLPSANSFNGEAEGSARQPRGAVVSAQARTSFVSALSAKIARCSRQQRPTTQEARSLRPVVIIRLRQDGSLEGAPVVRSVEGLNATNRQYETQVREAIVRAVRNCAPYSGLPAELYDVPNGWRQPPPIRLNFQ